jgi:hypothetical protein
MVSQIFEIAHMIRHTIREELSYHVAEFRADDGDAVARNRKIGRPLIKFSCWFFNSFPAFLSRSFSSQLGFLCLSFSSFLSN